MDTEKAALSLKDRLLHYQENARKQKEYDRKHNLSVSQLDSSMTDVSRYSRPSSVTNRKATTVSADMVNRLDPNLLEDFNASASLNASASSSTFLQSPVRGYQSPVKGFRSPTIGYRSPVMNRRDLSSRRDEVETRDEPELRDLFLNALANLTGEDVKQIEADAKVLEVDPKGNLSDLRSRYLRSIFALIPDYGDISHLSKERRLTIFREDAHKREAFVNIRDAWDMYEQKSRGRPHEPTAEDKEIETQIKATEIDISTKWANLAEQVVDDILEDEGETQAEDGDDSLLACVEAARGMVTENEHRQKYKDRIDLKRQYVYLAEQLKEEDPELLEESLRLKEESLHESEYNSTTSFVLVASQEDRTENSEGDSRWKEEARRQRLADQARIAAGKVGTYQGYEDDSEQDEDIINQAKRLRRAYIRHLANQKDSDSDSDEDEDVDTISKWISEARQLKQLSRSRSKLHMSLSGSNSSVLVGSNNSFNKSGLELDAENDEGSLNRVSKVSDSDTSDSGDSNYSSSVYLWREEARRMKEKVREKRDENDDDAGANFTNTAEESEGSFYEDVVRKAMELEKKYSQRRSMLNNNESKSSSNEDDLGQSHWLEEARKIKAKGRYKLDDPGKQAWLDEAKRLREDSSEGNIQGNGSDINDEEIALKALQLRQGDKSANNEIASETPSKEEISNWVQKARMNETERRKMFGSSEAWLEEARRALAEPLAKNGAAENAGGGDKKPETSKDADIEIVKKAKKLRREYIREKLKFGSKSGSDEDDDEIDDLSRWIGAARAARERRNKKKKDKKKERKAKSASSTSSKVETTTLPDQASADAPSQHKEEGSSRLRSQWILEARNRKERALHALKAAKEEVRARQSMSAKGLTLEEKKKLRLARLQEAMERREAEAKRDLEERRREAETIKMARRNSTEMKQKAFYSDSSGSDEDATHVETPTVGCEGARDDKHKKKKKSNRRTPASSSVQNHRRRKGTNAKDYESYDEDSASSDSETSNYSLGSTGRLDATGVAIAPNEKLSYPSEAFGSSSSESNFSGGSADHNTRVVRKIPDESAYIVDTDPSSSETVCSDSSAEAARVKRSAVTGRAITKKKARKPDLSDVVEHGSMASRRPKKNSEQTKESKPKSPKKIKKTDVERTSATLDSPTKNKKREEDVKSPSRRSPKKSKKREYLKAPKSPKKSMKSPKKMKRKEGGGEKDSHKTETSAVTGDTASGTMPPETGTSKEIEQEGDSAPAVSSETD